MNENEISYKIRGAVFKIHNSLGPGLLESVYHAVLKYELEKADLSVRSQVPLPVTYEDMKLDIGYRIDFIVNERVIVEIKSVEELAPVHYKQVLTYLKLTNTRLGLLINFNSDRIGDGMKRIVNNL